MQTTQLLNTKLVNNKDIETKPGETNQRASLFLH